VFLTLALMGAGAFVFAGWAKKKGWVKRNEAHVKIMASLPLGKDVFFVLRCGPEVLALASGPAGTRLLGRWKHEEWLVLEEKQSLEEKTRQKEFEGEREN
jgi:hypothetical protein